MGVSYLFENAAAFAREDYELSVAKKTVIRNGFALSDV